MENKLYIPKRIKIGFNNRKDTYTQKLGFVIYWDDKGVLRQENSWDGWRDKSIEPLEFDNIPTEGFVLNKGVGGARHSYGWNTRNEYVRVFDPRGFEFEISVENLLFILQECTSTKGKGLEGGFVYSWNGKNLVLLPVDSLEYKKSTEYTDNLSAKIDKKDMTPGKTYLFKDMSSKIYLGRYDVNLSIDNNTGTVYREKRHIFVDTDKNDDIHFHYERDFKKITKIVNENISEDFSDLLESFINSEKHQKIKEVNLKEISFMPYSSYHDLEYRRYKEEYLYKTNEDNVLISDKIYTHGNGRYLKTPYYQYTIFDNCVKIKYINRYDYYRLTFSLDEINEQYSKTKLYNIYYVFENGKTININEINL